MYLPGWKAKPFPHLRVVFWSLSECFCHSMLATNIVKIRHWLFPLCIRVIWPESIVLSTKQIPDCWLWGKDWGLMACFVCEWWQFFKANAGHYWPGGLRGGGRGWQYWGHTAGPSRLPSSSVRVRRSDLDCVSCVMFRIIVNTLYSITWILAPSTLSKHCELKLVTELRLNSSFQQRTFIKTSYSNSESVFWHLMKIWLTSTSLQRNAGNKNQDKTWK